jgi:hypothetical protein
MGRPLRKDVNGVDVIGSYGTTNSGDSRGGIQVEFFDTELRSDGVIVKQRGAKTYVVTQVANANAVDGYNENTYPQAGTIYKANGQIVCVLQETEPSAVGQMRMFGSLGGTPVALAKLNKRTARDFSGNRYTWQISKFEDSVGDVIVLTAA